MRIPARASSSMHNPLCFDGEAEERAEGGVAGFSSVEAKDELVEVGLQMFAAQPVVDAARPALEVGEDLVDPGEDEMSGGLAEDTVWARSAGVGSRRPMRGSRSARAAGGPGARACASRSVRPSISNSRGCEARPATIRTTRCCCGAPCAGECQANSDVDSR